ncbi:hypothetical protein [Thermomonas sp.]|uniref:hypothetical protein n=1 Tax=Thermomonas sp. TaxID=1971895 RepID=UPI0035B3ECF9
MSASRLVDGPGFRIRYDGETGYLRALVFDGTDSLAVSSAMWRMLGEECRARAVTRLLVVEDLLSTVDVPDIGAVVDVQVEAGFAAVRVAFVELRDDIQGSELAEIYSRERGLTNRVFSDEDEARRWLLYGD